MKTKLYNVDTCEEALELAANEFGVDKEELDASKIEGGIEVITIVDGVDKAKAYLPFLFSVFIFIFMGNLLGLVPMGFTFTGQLIPVGAFALLGLIVSSLIGIYHKGFSWFQTFMPAGIPRLLAPIVIPIEMISFIAKPFSLTVRLVMNMIVGHILLDIMAYFTTTSGLAGAFPLIFVLLMTAFELGIAFLQAYIYTILTGIYLGEAVKARH